MGREKGSSFSPVKRRLTLTDEIAGALRERVSSGQLSPGDRLPSEQQLAAAFQVSRTVIREAISRLKVEGLIDTRQGLRSFVAESLPHARLDSESIAKKRRIPAIFELRLALEPTAAALAAQRRSAAELKQLERHLKALRKAMTSGVGGHEAQAAFHGTIAKSSGNAHFVALGRFIQSTLKVEMLRSNTKSATIDGDPDQAWKEHDAVFRAIRDQDPNAAANAMSDHLHKAADRLAIDGQALRRLDMHYGRLREGE